MLSSHRNSIYEYFKAVPLTDLVPKNQHLVLLKEDQTLQEVVNQLSQHRILAAPVLTKEGKLLGMLSVLDIVQYIVASAPNVDQLKNLSEVEIAGRCITLQTAKNVMGFSARDQFLPLKSNVPSTMAVELFSQGVHRCVVEEDVTTDLYIGTLSQSDIVKRLSEHLHMGKLKNLGAKLASDLGLGLVQPVVVKESQLVLETMKQLASSNVSAVAVVNDKDELVGNFSASDLRGFYLDRLPHFDFPTSVFLEKYSASSLKPFCTKLEGLTFVELVKLLIHPEVQGEKLNHSMHRVWIVDDAKKVIGVITLTDIMKVIRDYDEQL